MALMALTPMQPIAFLLRKPRKFLLIMEEIGLAVVTTFSVMTAGLPPIAPVTSQTQTQG